MFPKGIITKRRFQLSCLVLLLWLPVVTFSSGQAEPVFDRPGVDLHLGTQPLGLAAGVVSELLGRDRILRRQLEDKGAQLQRYPFFEGGDMLPLMTGGKLDASLLGDMPSIHAVARHGAQIIAMVKHGSSSIVSRDYDSVAELKGRVIGYAKGSTAHFTLVKALSEVGMSTADVTLRPLRVSEMGMALDQGLIAAFAAWEPTPSMALVAETRNKVIYRGVNSSYLVLSDDVMRHRPEIAELLFAAVVRAVSWLQERPDNLHLAASWAIAAQEEMMGMPSELTSRLAVKLIRYELSGVAGMPLLPPNSSGGSPLLWDEFEFLKSTGFLNAELEWSDSKKRLRRDIADKVFKSAESLNVYSFDYDGAY